MVYQITILCMQLLISKRKKRTNPKRSARLQKYRSKLGVDFDTAPWDICNVFDDVEDSVWEFLYKNIIEDHIKERKVKIKAKSHPWVNTTIRKMMNKRYRLLLRAQRTK